MDEEEREERRRERRRLVKERRKALGSHPELTGIDARWVLKQVLLSLNIDHFERLGRDLRGLWRWQRLRVGIDRR
jgi:hypothetical protein